MELVIPSKVLEKLWDIWDSWDIGDTWNIWDILHSRDLRLSIVVSLLLQIFLVRFASSRQTSRRIGIVMSVWVAYLMANWIAAVAIGLITKSQTQSAPGDNKDLYALWASFLLIHLGGPDSITSYSMEDNELWIRHFFGLVAQVFAAAYSFFLTSPENKLRWPTGFVFVVGIIKFAERTAALYSATMDRFGSSVMPEPYPGPDYTDAVAIYTSSAVSRKQAEMTTATTRGTSRVDSQHKFFDEVRLLQAAYSLFENFKGLLVGFPVSSSDRDLSRNIFLNLSATDAFRMIEYELSFVYQLLHTKIVMVRCWWGYVARIVSFCSIVSALVSFSLVDKRGLSNFNISLSYALILVAVLLDIISVLNLIFSKWTLIFLEEAWIDSIPPKLLKGLRKRRWSWSVSQYNMLRYRLDERPKWLYKLAKYFGLGGIMEKIKILRNSESVDVTGMLQLHIFNELKMKSSSVNSLSDAIEACSQRGEWALLRTSSYIKLKWSIGEYQYAESLLIWHLATELCCYPEARFSAKIDDGKRRICKVLSDYIFYLIVMKPTMMAPVLKNWRVVFKDTCEEANRLFAKNKIKDHWQACSAIISVDTRFRPATVKGNISKSVLFDACILAHQLQNLEEDERWKVMDLVWVELLCYAAINCRPAVHAQQPSMGGELLTFTWLLMNHLGLGTQFYEPEQREKFMPVM